MRFPSLFTAVLFLPVWAWAAPVINEAQSTNTSLPDASGQLADWVEIHNTSDSPLAMQGYYLSDSLSNRLKFRFPDVTIPPRGFLIVWTGSVADFPNNRTPLHADFSISSAGEPVVLTAPDGVTLVDEFPALPIGTSGGVGRSIGRQPDGSGPLYFFNTPTQGASNTTSGTPTEVLPAPSFSVPGGMHTASVTVAVTTAVQGGTIRYTLDGSDPTESSPVYTGPLTLNSLAGQPNVLSQIPTNFLNTGGPFYEGWQPPDGEVFKINVVRARVFKAGSAPGRITTQSYLVHPSGAARYSYPVVSIATTPDNLFSNPTGIYVPGWFNNYAQEGSAWERPGNIEFYETDGSLAFQGAIGMRIHGNSTVNRPRKALRIYARNPDGPSTFHHRIFPEKDVSSFDTFLLRAGGNDWGQSILRDALVSTLAAHTGLDRMATRPAVVFIDGEYWGIHNVRDRIDEGYYKHHYGLSETGFTQLEVPATGSRSWPVHDRGEPSLLADFIDILDRAWDGEFAAAAGYEALSQRIDIDNFIDYQIHQIWAGNTDWPGNNVRLWRAVTPEPGGDPRLDGRWRWILYDTDFGLGLDFFYVPGVNDGPNHNTLAYASQQGGANFIGNSEEGTRMLRKTLENPGFRDKFVNRFADLLNSSLSAAHAGARLDEFEALYGAGMEEHVRRWRQPFSWTNDVARIRNYIQQRPAAVRGHIAGRFGLPGTAQLTVNVSGVGEGTVRVNTLHLGPGTEGVASQPYPWTGTYFRGVPVTLSAQAGPGYRFVSWTDSAATNTNGVTVLASDSTANYGAVWTNNPPNGGTGFNPWILVDTPSFDDGFFIGTSGRPIHGFSPDGRSFGIYGHSGGSASATRPFADGVLPTNRTFTVKLSPGGFSGTKGLLFGQAGTNRFGFTAGSTNGNPGYWFSRNGVETAITGSFSPDANSTFDVSVTHLGSNLHRMTIVRGAATFTTNFTATGAIDRAVFFHTNSAGSSDTNNLYFNLPTFTEPVNGGSPGSTNDVLVVDLTAARTLTANFAPDAAESLVIEHPETWALGTGLPDVRVIARTAAGDPDPAFAGAVMLVISGPGGFLQQLTADAVEGVATFSGIMLPSAGSYTLGATSGSLSTGSASALALNDAATFLPAGNGTWNTGTNWDIGVTPDGATARVRIPTVTADRNVNLTTNITAAAILFDNAGTTNRNRIRNNNATSSLTMQSVGGPASIVVEGTGAGHANLEFTNTGVLHLAGDLVLDVRNIAEGNAEYGALRLQGNVSGPGGLIKRGGGMAGLTGAGKTFSGDVLVEQGVLTFTEPAITGNNVTNYTVHDGGQLRLSSAGAPRQYQFKGPLNLAGSGRSGVAESANLGVLGALRLETGSTGTTAVLTNVVNLTASADIHAPSGNAIQLQGPLLGTGTLTKSGGGTLTLDTGASTFGGAITLNRGTLFLGGPVFTNGGTLTLAEETTLAGSGAWGGTLQVIGGAALAFQIGAAPPPQAPLRAGAAVFSGPVTVSVLAATNASAGTYPLLSVDGSFVGTNNLALAAPPPAFPASTLTVTNQTLALILRAALTDREQWLELHGLPLDGTGDGADDADPDRDGIANLIERAFLLNPVTPEGTLPVTVTKQSPDTVVVTYHVAKNQADLAVLPETAAGLLPGVVWQPVVPVEVDSSPPDRTIYQVELPAAPGAGFLRFRVIRN